MLQISATVTSCLAALLLGVALWPPTATAQGYPTQTIRIVVPTAPGGPNDVIGRLAAEFLGGLGQSVIVENRAGAGGAIAAREVARSRADGHTLMVGNTSTLAVNPAVSPNAGYDPVTSFAAIAIFWEASQVLAVHASAPWTTVASLVAHAKAEPGKLDYAHGGTGNLQHLVGELLMLRANVRIVGVPFKGSAESIQALVGRNVHLAFADYSLIAPLAEAGTLRALAVTSKKRSLLAPELPTMAEAGIRDFEATSFFGIVAPAGTPPDIVRLLNSALNSGLELPRTRTLVTQLGVTSSPGTPESFSAFIIARARQWREVAQAAGVRLN